MTDSGIRRGPRGSALADASSDEQVDGRRSRSLRTRQAVVSALISLQASNVLRPTGKEIARKAKVSVRSLFQHFPTHESLTEAVMEELGRDMLSDLLEQTPPEPLKVRVAMFASKRGQLLEKVVPHRRAAAVVAPLMTARINRRRKDVRTKLRNEVAVVFAPELSRLARGPSTQLLEALVCIHESEVWESLRRGQELSFAQARQMIEQLTWGQLLYHFGRAVRGA